MTGAQLSALLDFEEPYTFVAIRDRSYFMTKVMLAAAARRVLLDGVVGQPQQPEAGRQYYRLHPALHQHAERALRQLLSGVGSPVTRPGDGVGVET